MVDMYWFCCYQGSYIIKNVALLAILLTPEQVVSKYFVNCLSFF